MARVLDGSGFDGAPRPVDSATGSSRVYNNSGATLFGAETDGGQN